MRKVFKDVLVVVKETPYEQYLQLKAQGRAPVALRFVLVHGFISIEFDQCLHSDMILRLMLL